MMEKLKKHIEANDMSLGDFGKKVGVTHTTIYRYIHRDRFPSPQMIRKIQDATGGYVTVNDWYEGVR